MTEPAEQLRTILRRDLMVAFKARDVVTTAAIRSLLAAIDNAEAPPFDPEKNGGGHSEHVAGSVAGLGGAEVEPRHLTDSDLRTIIEGEIQERSVAATEYERIDRNDDARRVQLEAGIIRQYSRSVATAGEY